MSRIGRHPIALPAGVKVNLEEGNVLTVTGPLGTLTQKFQPSIGITVEANEISVTRPNDENFEKSIHGLTRTLINNMVIGVTQGYSKKLEIIGVGYRVQKTGKAITLNLGHSHPIVFNEENGITFDVPDANTIIVKGIDKQLVGEIAAKIRSKRPPEPFHGKGVRYEGEKVRRKAGKTGK